MGSHKTSFHLPKDCHMTPRPTNEGTSRAAPEACRIGHTYRLWGTTGKEFTVRMKTHSLPRELSCSPQPTQRKVTWPSTGLERESREECWDEYLSKSQFSSLKRFCLFPCGYTTLEGKKTGNTGNHCKYWEFPQQMLIVSLLRKTEAEDWVCLSW